jgi:hypothetical protein
MSAVAPATRTQVVTAGDALRELTQFVAIQEFAQFRLADEDDLQQLLGIGLKVGEQAHLLEDFGREVLRLIHHQHHALAGAVRLQQVLTEDVDQVFEAVRRRILHADSQLLADGEEELRRGHARIEDQSDFRMLRRLGQQ